MAAPKCFISYSWDTPQHEAWVLELAKKLRANGVEALLDKFELKLGYDLAQFMERSVRESDFVLLVCTPKFADKADGGTGGVGYEKQIVTGEIFNGAKPDKFVPVLRAGDAKAALPSYLKSKLFVDFRDEARFDTSFEQLLRHVFGEPAYKAPALGQRPNFSSSPSELGRDPRATAGTDLFFESFDDVFADRAAFEERYGRLWVIGDEPPWSGRIGGGKYELSNDRDATAVKYTFVEVGGAGDMRASVRVQVDGASAEPYSGAGLLLNFDPRTRYYDAFFVAQLEVPPRVPPQLAWASRDAAGFRIRRCEIADWLSWGKAIEIVATIRGDTVLFAANSRSVMHAPLQSYRGFPGLLAIGRGKFTFDDFRVAVLD